MQASKPAQAQVTAIHVNWTAPFFAGHMRQKATWDVDHVVKEGLDPSRYKLPLHELFTTVHSVLSWRKHHGPVHLYTDPFGADYFESIGLLSLYDHVDVETLEGIDQAAYSPIVYPNAGKVYAAANATLPFAMVDTDLYVLDKLDALHGERFVFAHWETVDSKIYPSPDSMPNSGVLPLDSWDASLCAANMCISYFGHRAHRDSYADCAKAFMHDNIERGPELPPVSLPAFAEQRIPVFEAARLGVEYCPVLQERWSTTELYWENTPPYLFHHTWILKLPFVTDPKAEEEYNFAMATELLTRFPEALERLQKIPEAVPLLEALLE